MSLEMKEDEKQKKERDDIAGSDPPDLGENHPPPLY